MCSRVSKQRKLLPHLGPPPVDHKDRLAAAPRREASSYRKGSEPSRAEQSQILGRAATAGSSRATPPASRPVRVVCTLIGSHGKEPASLPACPLTHSPSALPKRRNGHPSSMNPLAGLLAQSSPPSGKGSQLVRDRHPRLGRDNLL